MPVNARPFNRKFLPLLVGALVLAACAPKTPEDMVRSAGVAIQQGRLAEAVITLKQAIQAEPQSGPLRSLLGSALLKQGEPVAAEVEFRKAMELKTDPSGVVPSLAKSLQDQGQPKKVLDEFGAIQLTDPAAATSLALTLASAHASLGNRKASRLIVDRLLTTQPDLVPALLLKARLMAGTPEEPAANAMLEGVLAKDPKDADAWQVLGDLKLNGGSDVAGALQAFRKVVELRPRSAAAHAAIVSILTYQHDIEGADRQLQAMKQALPGNVETVYQEANVAFAKGEFKRAREMSQALLNLYPGGVRLLLLAGAAEAALDATKQAEALLSKALSIDAGLPAARRLLAQIYLRSGQSSKAQGVLRPLLQPQSTDGAALLLAGESYMLDGDFTNAEEYFKRAASVAPDNKQVQLVLAMSEFAKGKPDTGIAQLQALSSKDSGIAADMALITARLRMKQFDAALLAVEVLAKKQPGKPGADGLRGRIYLAQGKPEDARRSFEQAVTKDPRYFPAVASLAGLDIADKNPAAARQRFEAVLKIDPRNTPSSLALVDLGIRAGESKEEIVKLLDAAVKSDPGNAAPRAYLIEYLRSKHDAKSALVAAQQAVALHANNPEILSALAAAHVDNGEFIQALSVFHKLTSLQPKSPLPYMKIADTYLLNGDQKSAIQNLQRALELDPDLVAAQKNLIALFRKMNQPKQAYAVAKAIQVQRPQDAGGFAFEGDIAMEAKDWPRAVAAFKLGLGKRRGEGLSSRLYLALLRGVSRDEADRFSRDWLKSHADDVGLLLQLANTALSGNQLALAEAHYLAVVRLEPGNALALNNAAWALARQHKPGAVALAERAVAAQPDTPSFLDTLAYALAEEGDLPKALERQTQAVTLVPDSFSVAFNLAKLQLKAGDQVAAKAGLEKLAKSRSEGPLPDEVRRLLKTLP